MHSILMLTSLFLVCITANVLSYHSDLVDSPSSVYIRRGEWKTSSPGEKIYPDSKRAEQRKCSVPRYGTTHYKRCTEGIIGTNSSLWRRMILPEVGNQDQFIMDETGDQNTYTIVWNNNRQGDRLADFNTALHVEFREFPNKDEREFSLATTGLEGCTVLAIISRTGVYMAHYWEDISFAPSDDVLAKYRTADRAFQATVITGLTTGFGFKPVQQQNLNRRKIDDEHIHAYLLRPINRWNEPLANPTGYRRQWDAIKDTVGNIIPRLKGDSTRWTEIVYERVQNRDDLRTTTRGRCLFNYDPQHTTPDNQAPRKKAIWWTENNLPAAHDDEWDQQAQEEES